MVKRFYPAVLERGAKDTFGAWFPDFPDCVAAGRSQDEVIRKAELMLATAVDVLAELDQALPEPTAIESIVLPKGSRFLAFFVVGVEPPDPSERVNIYLPKSLIARADKRAAELGMSRSSFFGFAISTLIGGWKFGMGTPTTGLPRSKAEKTGELRGKKAPAKKMER
jgi:predicted RNase H-like HicB family nuclease